MKQLHPKLSSKNNYRYLDLFVIMSVAMVIIANTTAGKITQIGFLTVSVTVLYFPFTYIFGDLITEVYGYKHARRAMWILIYVQILAAIIYHLVTIIPAAPGFEGNEAFKLVFGQAPRIVLGGIIGLFVGQIVNDFTLAKMKVLTNGRFMWGRMVGSTVAGQFFDTVLFYTIALSNVIPSGLLIPTIISGWLAKSFVETAMTPISYRIIKKVKKLENEDYFDRDTNFNPFIFKSDDS